MKTLNLRNSSNKILISDKDFEKCKKYNWYLANMGYPVATIKGKVEYLHRFLMKPPKGLIVDHKNGDKLDNRRNNLRICTRNQNAVNSLKRKQKRGRKPYSKYKGVCFINDKFRTKPWLASIMVKQKSKSLGVYSTEEEAAFKYFGKFAVLNDIKNKKLIRGENESK